MPESVIDTATFDELLANVGGDRAFLAELVGTYLEDSPGLLDELRSAVASGDAASARRAAHTLKSTSASFGATGLADACRQIEQAAAAGELAGLDGQIAAVSERYDEVAAALRARIAEGDAA